MSVNATDMTYPKSAPGTVERVRREKNLVRFCLYRYIDDGVRNVVLIYGNVCSFIKAKFKSFR